MFFFGGLMVAVMIVFSLMAAFYYKYTNYTGQVETVHYPADETNDRF